MSYFDHASCPQCKTSFDPERVEAVGGRIACPGCGAPLRLTDLFGLRAAFEGEDEPDPSFDELVPGFSEGSPPQRGPQARPDEGAMVRRGEGGGSALDALRDLKNRR